MFNNINFSNGCLMSALMVACFGIGYLIGEVYEIKTHLIEQRHTVQTQLCQKGTQGNLE